MKQYLFIDSEGQVQFLNELDPNEYNVVIGTSDVTVDLLDSDGAVSGTYTLWCNVPPEEGLFINQ